MLCSCKNPLEKILFLRYRPKSAQSIRLQDFKMNYFSWANLWNSLILSMLIWPIWSQDSKIELTNRTNIFFACWYSFMKINLKILEVSMVKNGCDQSCDGALKLTVSEEWPYRINWFFARWYRFTKIKSWSKVLRGRGGGIVKDGCGQSGHGTLKFDILFFCTLVQIQES